MSSYIISFLTGDFPYTTEFQAFFMALQGAMKVRTGKNKDGKMNWFHAFCQGVVLSYAGGLLSPLWMGKPTSLLSNDINMASCIIAYILVNYVPLNIGFNIANLFPMRLLTVMGAQLFRAMGIMKFVDIAFNAFKDTPTKYYPTPILGPICNGMILGNMGSFFALGFEGHLKNEMPLPFKNGLFVSSFYHFLANDKGPIGEYLRSIIEPFTLGLTHEVFAVVVASLFMQSWAILQMPEFLGPQFNPFNLFRILSKRKEQIEDIAVEIEMIETTSQQNSSNEKKKKKRRKKNLKKKKTE